MADTIQTDGTPIYDLFGQTLTDHGTSGMLLRVRDQMTTLDVWLNEGLPEAIHKYIEQKKHTT